MNATTIEILKALPHCTDGDLRILIGRLTLNMYGAEVSEQCADYVLLERRRREAVAA